MLHSTTTEATNYQQFIHEAAGSSFSFLTLFILELFEQYYRPRSYAFKALFTSFISSGRCSSPSVAFARSLIRLVVHHTSRSTHPTTRCE
jgi:hypothetical protein